MPIKVGLAEDNFNLVRSLTTNFRSFEGVELVFTAYNGREVLKYMETRPADVILMDINMPDMNGIEATRLVKQKYESTKVIMFTVFDEHDKVFESILAGASGYLLKDETPANVLACIEEAMDGGAPMSPSIATKALDLIKGKFGKPGASHTPENFDLSKRELDILQEISVGLNYQQIGDKLFISPKTVRKHIENIYQKLHVHNKVEAVNMASKHRLLK